MPAHTYQRLPPRVFSAQSATQQHPDQSQDKQQEGLRPGEDRSESHRAQSLDPRDGLGHWKLATHESDYLETMGEEQELDACADDDDECNLGPQTEAERTSRKHQLNRSHTEMQDKIDTLNLKWRHERHTVDHVDSVEQGPDSRRGCSQRCPYLWRQVFWSAQMRHAVGATLGIVHHGDTEVLDRLKVEHPSRLIHPDSPFMMFVNAVSALLLVYSAVVTPVLLGFFWSLGECEEPPTLAMDMVVDVFFLAEIVLTFVVGRYTPQGAYVDSCASVAWRYARDPNGLTFDMLTSIPVSWLEYLQQRICTEAYVNASNGAAEASPESQRSLRVIRVLKPLKILKLFRILKAVRVVQQELVNVCESYLRLPYYVIRCPDPSPSLNPKRLTPKPTSPEAKSTAPATQTRQPDRHTRVHRFAGTDRRRR